MRQHNGTVYGPGSSPARPGREEVTASFEPTVAMFLQPQTLVPTPRAWSMLGRGLAIIGAVTLVLVCAGVGLFLASTMFCPCTIGGAP
jgi:hypothetical protein